MDKVIIFLATGGYSGLIPKCPGTVGTVVAIPLHFILILLPTNIYYLSLATILVLAIIVAGMAEKILDRADPGAVVIDEIIGMLIGLIGILLNIIAFLAAFIIFRILDILKPFPVGWLDRHLHGGTGIVLDDVVAGFMTLAIMQGLYFYNIF